MEEQSSGKKFVHGAMVMTLSTALVKVIGLLSRIPLLRFLGAEGMGCYNAAYEIYSLFYVISSAGLPVAVSILVSGELARGHFGQVRKIRRVSLFLFSVIGIVGSLLMFAGADVLAGWIGNAAAASSIRCIAPAVFFICIASAVRGFCQGCRDMVPSAVSQVVEALGKLILGLLCALVAARRGQSVAGCAAAAVLGLTFGTLLSAIVLLFFQKKRSYSASLKRSGQENMRIGKILSCLWKIAFPVTLGASLAGLSRIVDLTAIPRCLGAIGYPERVAAAIYGSYSTLALPICHLPASFVTGISASLIPSLTSAAETGNKEQARVLICSAFRLCVLLALPCTFGVAVFARPILAFLFAGEKEAIDIAAPLLSYLAPAVFSTCLLGVTNAILEAYRKTTLPIFSMLVGLLVKIVAAVLLLENPSVGSIGAPLSTVIGDLVTVAFNFYLLDRYTAQDLDIASLSAPSLLASVVSVGAAALLRILFLEIGLNENAAFVAILPVLVLLYFPLAIRWGALEKEDVSLLPFGNKVAKITEKLHSGERKERNRKENEYESGRARRRVT